jgi:aminoglycoside/choline kinase family phosphotransferase
MTGSSIPDLFTPSRWERVVPLAGDASTRRYSRLIGAQTTAILVEYPTPVARQLMTDLEVLAWCREIGIRVPDILASDLSTGRAILEDLGTADLESALKRGSQDDRPTLLANALDPLVRLAAISPGDLPAWNPPLDSDRMRWELAGFELWYLRHGRSLEPSPALARWLDDVAARAGRHPTRVCHRDYHLNNLMVSSTGEIGVIDIQDILIGPDTYDVVSLIYERAAARVLSADEQTALLECWAERTRPAPGWRRRADLVRIQRALKVMGTFARFVATGNDRYRPWLSELADTVVDLLEADGAPPDVTAFLLD